MDALHQKKNPSLAHFTMLSFVKKTYKYSNAFAFFGIEGNAKCTKAKCPSFGYWTRGKYWDREPKTFRWATTIKFILQINKTWFDKCFNNFAHIIICDFPITSNLYIYYFVYWRKYFCCDQLHRFFVGTMNLLFKFLLGIERI